MPYWRGGEQLYHVDSSRIDSDERDVYLKFEPGYTVPLEWRKRNNTSHQPYFFFSTSQLCLSFLNIPLVDFATKKPDVLRHPSNAYLLKRLVYQSVWPDLENRIKYTGFEKVRAEAIAASNRLQEKFGTELTPFVLSLRTSRAQLQGEMNPA